MKKINSCGIITLFLLLITFSGCSNAGYPYPDDLPNKKGWISILIIHSNDDKMEKPEFLSDYTDKNIYKIIQVDYNKIDNVYPLLKIDNAPYYLFLDHNGIVYETSDIQKANTFYSDNVSRKTD